MGRYTSPIVTSALTGSVVWVVDSIIFALGQPSVSISGALFTEVSVLRLSVRLLVFLCCLLVGVYLGYRSVEPHAEPLEGFQADELFTDADYLAASHNAGFSGDDTLRGFSYVESVNKNPDIDVANRPIYFSEHIKRTFNQPSRRSNAVKCAKAKRAAEDLRVERFDAIQKNDSLLLWQYCGKLGSALKLDVKELAIIRTLCYAYDIGRSVDGATYETHARLGADIVADIPELAPAAELVLTHHEKWDGSGLLGLSGLDIPLGSRIFALAWVYNAFTKPYGAWRLSTEDALDMLQMYAGTALDPELVAVFTGMFRQRSLAGGLLPESGQLRQIS